MRKQKELPLGSDMGERSDEDLMTSFSSGDREAFNLLVRRYQEMVWRIAWRYTGNNEDARDICQTVFLNLYSAKYRYTTTATFRTYLFRITNNACIDLFRKKRPEIVASDYPVATVDAAPMPDELLEKSEQSRKLYKALAHLPERQKRAVVLRYEADLSIKDIAAAMGVTPKAVERLLAHARETLQDKI